MVRYSHERKEAVLSKLLPPYNLTVAELARQEGISEAAALLVLRKKLNALWDNNDSNEDE